MREARSASSVLVNVVRRGAHTAVITRTMPCISSPLSRVATLYMASGHVRPLRPSSLPTSFSLFSRIGAQVSCAPGNSLQMAARHFRKEGSRHPNHTLVNATASTSIGDGDISRGSSARAKGMSEAYTHATDQETSEAEASAMKEEEEELQKDKAALQRGVFGVVFAILCVLTIIYGSRRAKKRYFGEDGSARVSVESRGRPALGGPFVLVNTKGEPVSQAQFLGSWTFFYFGFTHCPEICPVELNRMTHVVNTIREKRPEEKVVPLFVSCDPRRDSLEAIDEYLSVFHPDFVGLVGTPKQVNDACKSYRIYYSVPTEEDAMTEDYLIDHSIAIFLFDPRGRFVDFFGNRYNEHEIADKILHYMQQYEKDPTWTNW